MMGKYSTQIHGTYPLFSSVGFCFIEPNLDQVYYYNTKSHQTHLKLLHVLGQSLTEA